MDTMNHQGTLDEERVKLSRDPKETSRLAALRAAPRAGTLRRKVLQLIVSAGEDGATDDEISQWLHKSPNSTRPRRVELVEGGWIVDNGLRRDSAYGNPSIAWVATPVGVLLVASK